MLAVLAGLLLIGLRAARQRRAETLDVRMTLPARLSHDIARAARLWISVPEYHGGRPDEPYEITNRQILRRLASLIPPETPTRPWRPPLLFEGGLYVDVYLDGNTSRPEWKLWFVHPGLCLLEVQRQRLDLPNGELYRRLVYRDFGRTENLPQPSHVAQWWAQADELSVDVRRGHSLKSYTITSRDTISRLASLITPVSTVRRVSDFGENSSLTRVTIELVAEYPPASGRTLEKSLALVGRALIYGHCDLRFAFDLPSDELFRRLKHKDLESPTITAAEVVAAWRRAERIEVANSLNNGGRKGTIQDRFVIKALAGMLDPEATLSESKGSFGRIAAIDVRLFAHKDDPEPGMVLKVIRGRVVFPHRTYFLEFPVRSDELWDRLTYLRFDSMGDQRDAGE